jgi:hypothetical protein
MVVGIGDVLDNDAARDGNTQGPGSSSCGLEEGRGLGSVDAIAVVLLHFPLLEAGRVSSNEYGDMKKKARLAHFRFVGCHNCEKYLRYEAFWMYFHT